MSKRDPRDTRDPAPGPTDRSAGLPEPERGGSGGYADRKELDRLEKIEGDGPDLPVDRGAIPPDADEKRKPRTGRG
jgi:hypothetical protein